MPTLMKSHLENESIDIEKISQDLDQLAIAIDQKHRQQRKIQFFLDIRGYFIVNRIHGSYAEFGLYRGEMLYSAHKILGHIGMFKQYIGLDTFSGEPQMSVQEKEKNPFIKEGDFSADYDATFRFLSRHIKDKLELIKGDFRDPLVAEKLKTSGSLSLVVVDCNVLSSIRSALDLALPNMTPGGVLFMDDYFVNMGQGRCETGDLLEERAHYYKRKLVYFQTYAPCSRAFVVL